MKVLFYALSCFLLGFWSVGTSFASISDAEGEKRVLLVPNWAQEALEVYEFTPGSPPQKRSSRRQKGRKPRHYFPAGDYERMEWEGAAEKRNWSSKRKRP